MTRRQFAALAAVIVLVRLVVALWVVPGWQRDNAVGQFPDGYPQIAESLLNGQGFGFIHGANPTTVRGPGYPVWLALGMGLGFRTAPLLAFWSTLPGAAAALLLAWYVAGRVDSRTGILVGAVAGLNPLAIFIAARCMSDEFYAALGVGAVLLILRGTGDAASGAGTAARFRWTDLAGSALLGLQILTRSTAVLVLLALVAGLRPRGARQISRCAAILAVALLPAVLWSVRTSRLEGRPVFVHSLAAYNFWVGESYHRHMAGITWSETRYREMSLILPLAGIETAPGLFWYGNLSPSETAEMEGKLGRAARAHVLAHPLDYAWRVAAGVPRFWVQAQTSGRTRQYIVLFMPLLVAGLIGCGARARLPAPLWIVAGLVIVLHNMAYAALLPVARMSVQVLPFASLFVGLGLDEVLRHGQRLLARTSRDA